MKAAGGTCSMSLKSGVKVIPVRDSEIGVTVAMFPGHDKSENVDCSWWDHDRNKSSGEGCTFGGT